MDRLARDPDNPYVQRRNVDDSRFEKRAYEYDTYSQPRTDNRLSGRQNYDPHNQDGYYTYIREQDGNDHPTNDRRFRDSRYEDERERIDAPQRTQSRIAVNDNQEVHRRSNLPDQIQQIHSVNPRSFVVDINISIYIGSRDPQISAHTNHTSPRSSPIRSTAIIEDGGFIELDIRAPDRTTRLATDGLIRYSPSNQSTNFRHENDK